MLAKARLLATSVGLSVAACGGISGDWRYDARDAFVEEASCPRNRVAGVVRRRDLEKPLPPYPTPPADIAADAGRLAVWRKHVDNERNASLALGQAFYEVTGCGQTMVMACSAAGLGTDQPYVACHPQR